MSMRIADIIKIFDAWAPEWVASEKDNVGLQIGDKQCRATNILITLDVTEQVVNEAIKRKAELIISHHPLLFRPISSIKADDLTGSLILQLAKHRVALFSAHTNLDFTQDGVSFTLGKALGLKKIRFLSPIKNSIVKIAVFVPPGHAERVMHAMSQAGAGVIGEYSSCSFITKGKGSFRGSSQSNPSTGSREKLELIEETRLEMVASRANINQIITAMKEVHPYEEVAYDIFLSENPNPNFGMGAIGSLPKPQPVNKFLSTIKRSLGSKRLRYTSGGPKVVRNVAVCGGAGGDLLPNAISAGADIFVTADIRYHTFHSAADKIVLVDAGHWETEQVVLKSVAERLRAAAGVENKSLNIFIAKHNTNPIKII